MKRAIIGVVIVMLIGLVLGSGGCARQTEDYNRLAIEQYEKGNYHQAIEYCDKAIESDPNDALAYNSRGLAYAKLGEYDRAISDYDKAIELKPDYAVAYHNRGLAYFHTGGWMNTGPFDEAISDFTKAIELDPDYVDAYYDRGTARLQFVHFYQRPFSPDVVERFNGALGDFDKALELDPGFVLAYAGKGNAYDLYGEFDEATKWYNKALEFKDKIPERWGKDALAGVYSSRARNYMRTEDIREAVSDYQRSLELEPEDPATVWLTLSHLMAAYWDLEQFDKVLDTANRTIEWLEANPAFLKHNPMAYHMWLGRGYAYYKLGEDGKAIEDLKKTESLTAWPDPEVYKCAAEVYSGIGEEEKARQYYEKIVEICTGLIMQPTPLTPAYVAYNHRGLAYLGLGECEKAISDFEKVTELSPKIYPYGHVRFYPEGYINLGTVYAKMGDKEKARGYYEEAISIANDQRLEFTKERAEKLLGEL